MSLYTGYLVGCKKQSSTVKSYISAIKAVLCDIGIELDLNRCLITSLTRACRIVNDSVRTRLPIKKTILNSILKGVQQHFANQSYLMKLYLAMFSTAYFGLFRVGEITRSPHVALADDVMIAMNKEKIQFTLRSSQTHDKSTLPQKIQISSVKCNTEKGRNEYCPYKLLRGYLEARPKIKNEREQFFVFTDNSPVRSYQFSMCLKMILKETGHNHQSFSSHSFRIGRCCDLLKYGVSVETIKQIGSWKSNTVFNYLRNL